MNKLTSRHVLALLTLTPFGAAPLWAQSAPTGQTSSRAGTASSAPSDQEGVVALDPFTVSTEQEGYQAVDTLGGARIRTKLADTPASISVITKKFMDDLGITDAQSLLIYTNNTEVAGLGGNFSGVASRGSGVNSEGQRLASPANATRARGLAPLDNTRNFFPTDIPWDGYDISRVDITRGPNSFLFGFGSRAGISIVATIEAAYTD